MGDPDNGKNSEQEDLLTGQSVYKGPRNLKDILPWSDEGESSE